MGYLMGLLTCLFVSSYTTQQKIFTKSFPNFNLFSILLYNYAVSFPVILLWVLSNGTFQHVLSYPHISETPFVLAFAGSVVVGFVLNYASFLCTHVNTPLATSMVGNLKTISTDLVGLFAFKGVTLTAEYLSGIVLATVGGLAYSVIKLKLMMKERNVLIVSEVSGVGGVQVVESVENVGGIGGAQPLSPRSREMEVLETKKRLTNEDGAEGIQ